MGASHKQYKWSLRGMVLGFAALVTGFGLAQSVQAQEWPAKPVRLVSPYPPGGVADIAARLISAKLADIWKQQVLVENRVGGGGVVGTEHVAKAAPDGYTFLVATVGEYTITPHMYAKLNFNVSKDLAPVIFATDTPLIFAANAGASFNNVKEMIAYSRSVAGGLSYASPGLATVNHVVAERFALESGAKLVHVPYKGGGPAGAALAGGEIPLGLVAVSSAAPHIKTGRVKAIGVTAAARVALGPDWPTVSETMAGFTASNWVGVAAPAGTPRAILEKANADMNRALKFADVKEKLNAIGTEPGGGSIEDFANRIRIESEQFAKVVRQINLRLD